MTDSQDDLCRNCQQPLSSRYCGDCGQKGFHHEDYKLSNYAAQAFNELFSLDSRTFKSFLMLLLKPGYLTAEYLAGRQKAYLSPLRIFLVCSALFFFFGQSTIINIPFILGQKPSAKLDHVFDKLAEKEQLKREEFLQKLDGRFKKNYKLIKPLAVGIFALAVMLLLWGRDFYYVEHLIFGYHIYAFNFLLAVIQALVYRWFHFLALPVVLALDMIYLGLALKRTYRFSVLRTCMLALALSALNFLISMLVVMVSVAASLLLKS